MEIYNRLHEDLQLQVQAFIKDEWMIVMTIENLTPRVVKFMKRLRNLRWLMTRYLYNQQGHLQRENVKHCIDHTMENIRKGQLPSITHCCGKLQYDEHIVLCPRGHPFCSHHRYGPQGVRKFYGPCYKCVDIDGTDTGFLYKRKFHIVNGISQWKHEK